MPPWMYSDKQPCGTPAAYKRHLRHGESPCRACRQAEARRYQDKYPKAKASRQQRRDDAADELAGRIDAARSPGTASRYLLDICEAIDGPDPEWYSERRADGAA